MTVEFSPTTNTNGLWDSVLVTAASKIDPNIKAPTFGARVQGDGCIGEPSYTKNCFDDTRIGSISAAKSNALVISNKGQGPLKVISIKPIAPLEFESLSPIGPFDIPLQGSRDISAVFIPQKKEIAPDFLKSQPMLAQNRILWKYAALVHYLILSSPLQQPMLAKHL